jgi:hypothetical protein
LFAQVAGVSLSLYDVSLLSGFDRRRTRRWRHMKRETKDSSPGTLAVGPNGEAASCPESDAAAVARARREAEKAFLAATRRALAEVFSSKGPRTEFRYDGPRSYVVIAGSSR